MPYRVRISDSQATRHAEIMRLVDSGEVYIGVLLSAADFEWTVSRAILVLGQSRTAQIRSILSKTSGLWRYEKLWRAEVKPGHAQELNSVVTDWANFETNFEFRHKIIHGRLATTGYKLSRTKIESFLKASENVWSFAASRGMSLQNRLQIRR